MPRLPIKDAAEYLAVSVDTVRRRLRRGELHGEFVDGRWFVDVPEHDQRRETPAVTALALRVLEDEVSHLRTENERLMAIIELLVQRDPEKKHLLERFLNGRP